MQTLKLGKAVIEAEVDFSEEDRTVLQRSFAELKEAYPDVSDDALAHHVFFSFAPGMEAEDVVASAAAALGSHS